MVLARQSGWITKSYPIEYIDSQGVRRATWPSRFPLGWVEEKREEFQSPGLQAEFSQEYLCVPEDAASKVFLPSMIQLKPRTRTYEPVFACYDPARASTGSSISMPSSRKRSILPITVRGRRSRVSISPWNGPLTRLPVK
jgi:hypothetical protein